MTPAGVITEFPIPTTNAAAKAIVAGPDGNIWFTEFSGNKIGRITTAGVVTEFQIPDNGALPTGIAAGADGRLWFIEGSAGVIGTVTTAGVFGQYPVPHATAPGSVSLNAIASGPDSVRRTTP